MPPTPLTIPYAAVGPSSYASNATLTPHYASLHPPNMPPMLLTILTLAVPTQHASNAAYHPYACSALPTCLDTPYHPNAGGVPSRHASNIAYHPYACIVPTQHASHAAYHPYACSSLPT
ncbi:hypothetical protein O181_090742 [Austropuccinia psidii MF-1]|uniref:Uncharacterized protein n=1 Tax=Austropuccinia psidii MF-1 TaxID=1389203 RepID=A0A9Q3IW51_9BASI|nr:hypothetical protein [Austropuccinia psidii MF-1]